MILVDANILLYAYNSKADQHCSARAFWESSLSTPQPVGLAWSTILAFLRIGTNPRVFEHPMTIAEACGHVSGWLERPMLQIIDPTSRHWEVLQRLLVHFQAPANLVPDAHLAALAIEHGATLYSADQGFARFGDLSWRNPL